MANRTVKVWLEANAARYIAAMKAAGAATRDLHDEIDKTNDRTAWLAQSILALTPSATTLGAGAVPVIAGLATQLTVAAGAAGVMALGFNGVGDALGALNDYQLDPTEEKLEKLEEQMDKVGETGQEFVLFLDSLGPQFRELANTSREGMFPGVTEGLREIVELLPELDRVVDEFAQGIGQLASDAGSGLNGAGFADFFNYLENDARPILVEFGRTLGNFAEGMANMIVAFGPLSSSYSKGLLEMSSAFVDWSDNLKSSTGFAEFVDYVREAGPLALDFLGSLATTLVEILEAAAPVGAVALPILTTMLDVIGALADTPLGPTVIAFAALTSAWGRLNAIAAITGSGVMAKATAGMRGNLATAKMLTPSIGELGTSFYRLGQGVENQDKKTRLAMTQTKAFGKAIAPVAGQAALLGFAMSGASDKMGLTNTATLALAGSMLGPYGAAAGAAIGFTMDFAKSNDSLVDSLDAARDALDQAYDDKAGTVDMNALSASVENARQRYIDLTKEVEKGGLAGVKFQAESIFGKNDVEEAYEVYMQLEKDLGAIREREARASRERAADQSYYLSIQAETNALEDNIDAMREKRAEASLGLNAELDYQEAILDASAAAKDYNDVLQENGQLTPKLKREGIAAKRELDNLAQAWNGLTDEAQNVPGRYRKAIDTFVDTAVAMGMGKVEARKLAREILNIPTSHKTEIVVDADAAFQKLRAVRRSINSIDRNIVVGVNIVRGDSSGLAFLSGGVPRADGGDIPGPSGVYGDKVLVAAAPTEFMVSNRYGQADKNRAALRAANAGAKLAVVGYADGGTISATGRSIAAGRSYPASVPAYADGAVAGGLDYDRLVGGIANEFRTAADDANEAIGRGIARESGRPWTQNVRRSRAVSLGGRPA